MVSYLQHATVYIYNCNIKLYKPAVAPNQRTVPSGTQAHHLRLLPPFQIHPKNTHLQDYWQIYRIHSNGRD